ncbi:MAG: DNA translocase FtsK 4TM domain-containing protein, partial [Chthoniobacteraceae bacterium]
MPSARATHPQSIQEALGLTLLGVGTLLFLALISYHPRDVPTWFFLNSGVPVNKPAQDFIGPLGAIAACVAYSFLGAAAYLGVALLLSGGGIKLLRPGLHLSSRLPWAIAFILSGACLAHFLPVTWLGATELNLAGNGGWVGKWMGETLLMSALGSVGAIIVLLLIYVVSLILMTGVHPMQVLREALAAPGRLALK